MTSKYNAWFHSYKTANLHLMYVRSLWINNSLSTTCAQHTREVKNSSFNMFFFPITDACNPLVYRVLDDHRRSVAYRPSPDQSSGTMGPQPFWSRTWTTNLLTTSGLCNIIFVIWTCFQLTNFFGEEKFSCVPSKDKVADERLYFQRHTHIFSSNCNVQFFHQPFCF